MNYRHLTKEEINSLRDQGCHAGDWESIYVTEGFSTKSVLNTRFEGLVNLGDFSGRIESAKNITRNCGIYNSFVSNCQIGDNVLIDEVRYISNYIVEENVAITNVGSMIVDKETSFGNGTVIEVLNEGGGRELPVFDRLSAQIAYLAVLYRHDREFTGKLTSLIRSYCDSKKSVQGVIESGARIDNSNIIRNVSIGSFANISGATLLEDGSVRSCKEDPVIIGPGVTAKQFIILSGSVIDGGAIIEKTFVGQGVRIGKQYSAENSLFFANSEAYHGEACSLFAGPYTVTHHKSTLMIACLVSFFNAGSGTNQSNHMYKLGPLHQGILERGSKTSSFSYLLFPCHIGAYTVVVGKHYSNFDTSDLPFSYITEEKGRSEITPAFNLFTVGTRRDAEKWPARDRRKDPDKLDLIHFDFLNPYIIGKVINGIAVLNGLAEKNEKKQDYISYRGINIHRLLLKTTRKYYEMILRIYAGQEVADRIQDIDNGTSLAGLKKLMASGSHEGTGKWADICGMFSPVSKIEELVHSVKTGNIGSVSELNEYMASIHAGYKDYAWTWCSGLISKEAGFKPEELPVQSLVRILTDWKTTALKLNKMILNDAEKEFDPGSRIGYGIDGDDDTRNADFQAVRGTYDRNKFVNALQNESKEIAQKADRLIAVLESLKE